MECLLCKRLPSLTDDAFDEPADENFSARCRRRLKKGFLDGDVGDLTVVDVEVKIDPAAGYRKLVSPE